MTAALQIVDEQGPDALTLRHLAQHLNSGTATLYRRFASREDLIAQVVDLLLGEIEAHTQIVKDASWQQACRTLAHGMFAVFSHHRNAAPLLLKTIPNGPNAMAQRERSLAVLLDCGLPPPLAARAYATLARYVLGFAIQLTDMASPYDNNAAQDSVPAYTFDKTTFPAIFAVAAELPLPLEEEFSFGLELMISGLDLLRKTS